MGSNYFNNDCRFLLLMEDSVVKSIIEQYKQRSDVGIEKYNTTLDRKDLTLTEWLEHLKQELMDATLYLQRLQNELEYVEQKMERLKRDNHNQEKRRYGWHF